MIGNKVTFTYKLKMAKQGGVSFSPQKHKLLEKLQNDGTGCELKKFRLSNRNETIINDYTSVREVQLNFRKIKKNVNLLPQHISIMSLKCII